MPISAGTEQPYRSASSGKSPDPLSRGYFNYVPNEAWKPNVNLYETDSAYLVCVDLAGVEKHEIDVTVEQQTLHIRGNRTVPTFKGLSQKARFRIHLMEIDHGQFSRDVELPANVEQGRITASHRDGMLWIELPKSAAQGTGRAGTR